MTFEDCLQHNHGVRALPDFDPSMRQLSDARTATSDLSAAEVRAMAKLTPFGPDSRRAIMVGDQVMHAVTRMYEAQVEYPGEVAIFTTEHDALEWLDLVEHGEEVLAFICSSSEASPGE